MDRKERLKQVMIDEAETIRKVAERVDYNVMSQITELLCQVKKNSKKVILAGCGTAGQAAKRIAHHAFSCGDSRILPVSGRLHPRRSGGDAAGRYSDSAE